MNATILKTLLTILAAPLFRPLAALHLQAATSNYFSQEAGALFIKNCSVHAWNETDHTVDVEDWSLPLWMKPALYSGVQIKPNLVCAEFPGRIQRGVSASC